MKLNDQKKARIDVNTEKSRRKGLQGFAETMLRRFKVVMHLLMIAPLYLLGSICFGLGILPGALLYQWVDRSVEAWAMLPRTLMLTTTAAAGYYIYCMTIIFVVPFLNWILRAKLSSWRGLYYSLPAIRWYIHNGSTYLVRFTALEFITPTPLNIWFFKMMGMKIGSGTIINSSYISDPSLISIGKHVTIGGSVTIVGHYGQSGFLVLAPVTIGDRVTVGLRASIMGGAQIGDDAKIMPHSVVMPRTVVGPGETWGGVPAVCLKKVAVRPNDSGHSDSSGAA